MVLKGGLNFDYFVLSMGIFVFIFIGVDLWRLEMNIIFCEIRVRIGFFLL